MTSTFEAYIKKVGAKEIDFEFYEKCVYNGRQGAH